MHMDKVSVKFVPGAAVTAMFDANKATGARVIKSFFADRGLQCDVLHQWAELHGRNAVSVDFFVAKSVTTESVERIVKKIIPAIYLSDPHGGKVMVSVRVSG